MTSFAFAAPDVTISSTEHVTISTPIDNVAHRITRLIVNILGLDWLCDKNSSCPNFAMKPLKLIWATQLSVTMMTYCPLDY